MREKRLLFGFDRRSAPQHVAQHSLSRDKRHSDDHQNQIEQRVDSLADSRMSLPVTRKPPVPARRKPTHSHRDHGRQHEEQ